MVQTREGLYRLIAEHRNDTNTHTHTHSERELLTQPQGAEEQQQDNDGHCSFALYTHPEKHLPPSAGLVLLCP